MWMDVWPELTSLCLIAVQEAGLEQFVSLDKLNNGKGGNMNFKYSIGNAETSTGTKLKTLLRDGQTTYCFLNAERVCCSGCAAFNLYDGVFELKCMPQLTEYGYLKESIIPTLDQVLEHFKSMNKEGGRDFYLHYKSNGWMIGNNKVKDWKALAEKWKPDIKKKTFSREIPKHRMDCPACEGTGGCEVHGASGPCSNCNGKGWIPAEGK